jgi:hypothetical protein
MTRIFEVNRNYVEGLEDDAEAIFECIQPGLSPAPKKQNPALFRKAKGPAACENSDKSRKEISLTIYQKKG